MNNGNIPTLMLPLRLETRFVDRQLWIRVFPDEPFFQSHNPAISSSEQEDVLFFKNSDANAKKIAWQRLVKYYGVYRASYLVRLSESESEFENARQLSYQEDVDPKFNWLPDRFRFFLYAGDKVHAEDGNTIDYKDGLIAFEDVDINSPNSGKWLTSFKEAELRGMAIKITIPEDWGNIEKIDRIIVVGFRRESDSIEALKELLDNHKYSKGVSLLEYGTPTNNFENERSIHSSRDKFEVEESFEYVVKGNQWNEGSSGSTAQVLNHIFRVTPPEPIGKELARALGLRKKDFKYVKKAASREISLLSHYQATTWFAMAGQSLKMMFGDAIPDDTHQKIWEHYSKYVRNRGPLASIKIGNQPYGILPVTSLKPATWQNPDDFLTSVYPVLRRLFNEWKAMAKDNVDIPKVHTLINQTDGKDPYEEILEVLNMQEHSMDFQLRVRKYDRISTRIPGWLSSLKNIPTPLPTLPLEMVYKLLDGRPEIAGYIDSINDNRGVLSDLNLGDLFNQNPKKEYAYNLSFRDDLATRGNVALEYKLIEEGEAPNDSSFSMKLTESNSGLLIFKKVLNELKKSIGKPANETTRDTVLHYESEQPSLFIDFWLRGYAGAAQLYHRIIHFQPTFDQLKTFKSFKVKSPVGKQSKSVIITDGQKELTIAVPDGTKIEEFYVSVGDELMVGQRLFLVQNKGNLKKVNEFFHDLGVAMLETLEGLSQEESRKLQKQVMLEISDLSSYRMDAWITSLATRRLENIRRIPSYKHKLCLGAYGWLEDLVWDKESTVSGTEMRDENNKSDGGIIHCPTPNQSLVATLFKNSFLTHQKESDPDSSNPFALNLTSDRIQKSKQFMEGIRQGQSIEALLGYRMERYLHERELDKYIYEFRRVFPLEVNIINRGDANPDVGFSSVSVIDGLKIIAHKHDFANLINAGDELDGQEEVIRTGISQLEEILDGSADILYYEAGLQYMNGNFDRAAAAIDATVGKIEPPESEAIKTRIPGTGINHKFIMLFDKPKKIPIDNPKGYLEPSIEGWLQSHLGDMNKIGCKVELYEGAAVYEPNSAATPFAVIDVKLDKLGLSYSDLLYLSETPISDGAGELERRIWNYIMEEQTFSQENITYKITDQPAKHCQSLSNALEWLRYAFSILSRSRYLKPEDLSNTGEEINYDIASLLAIRKRMGDLSVAIGNRKNDITYLSNFDLQQAKRAFLSNQSSQDNSNDPIDIDKIYQEVASKIGEQLKAHLQSFDQLADELSNRYFEGFECLNKAASLLFGSSFLLFPPVFASEGYAYQLKEYQAAKVIGLAKKGGNKDMTWGQPRVQVWVEKLAQVAKGASIFEEWQMINTVWGEGVSENSFEYKVLQSNSAGHPHWIGLAKEEIDELRKMQDLPKLQEPEEYYPRSSESLVLYVPSSIKFKSKNTNQRRPFFPLYGIVIEEFSEHIPDKELSTGLSFHYNGPNVEAPQSFLLAVKDQEPQDNTPWTEEDLADILNDTLDLAKIRALDLEAIEKLAFAMPLVNLNHIPEAN